MSQYTEDPSQDINNLSQDVDISQNQESSTGIFHHLQLIIIVYS